MANPFSGIITSDFKTLFTNMIDALLEDAALTVPCQLTYEGTKWTLCSNCLLSPITGKSTGQYNGTGPVNFTYGICPVCGGIGRIADKQTDTFYMCVLWDYKSLIGNIKVDSPDGFVQTISKINLLDNIKRANEILIDTNIKAYEKNVFQKYGESDYLGLGASSYIATMWERKR